MVEQVRRHDPIRIHHGVATERNRIGTGTAYRHRALRTGTSLARTGIPLPHKRTGSARPWRTVRRQEDSAACSSSNVASAARKSSTISAAITSGAGRLAEASSASSRSQNTSRLALSRATSSA